MVKQRNEIGYTMCRAKSGRLVRGPINEGTPTEVKIPIQCPVGTMFEGLYHTHPGGSPIPSSQDVDAALRVGAKILCVDADGVLECYRVIRP